MSVDQEISITLKESTRFASDFSTSDSDVSAKENIPLFERIYVIGPTQKQIDDPDLNDEGHWGIDSAAGVFLLDRGRIYWQTLQQPRSSKNSPLESSLVGLCLSEKLSYRKLRNLREVSVVIRNSPNKLKLECVDRNLFERNAAPHIFFTSLTSLGGSFESYNPLYVVYGFCITNTEILARNRTHPRDSVACLSEVTYVLITRWAMPSFFSELLLYIALRRTVNCSSFWRIYLKARLNVHRNGEGEQKRFFFMPSEIGIFPLKTTFDSQRTYCSRGGSELSGSDSTGKVGQIFHAPSLKQLQVNRDNNGGPPWDWLSSGMLGSLPFSMAEINVPRLGITASISIKNNGSPLVLYGSRRPVHCELMHIVPCFWRNLSIGAVVDLFHSILLESKVLVHGSDVATRTRIVAAIRTIMHSSINYPHPIATVLPESIDAVVLDSPSPLVAGVRNLPRRAGVVDGYPVFVYSRNYVNGKVSLHNDRGGDVENYGNVCMLDLDKFTIRCNFIPIGPLRKSAISPVGATSSDTTLTRNLLKSIAGIRSLVFEIARDIWPDGDSNSDNSVGDEGVTTHKVRVNDLVKSTPIGKLDFCEMDTRRSPQIVGKYAMSGLTKRFNDRIQYKMWSKQEKHFIGNFCVTEIFRRLLEENSISEGYTLPTLRNW